MQITLCEDDSIFFNGVPKNIVISVVFDDGKKLRVPYSASKSISQLYEDLSSISGKEVPKIVETTEVFMGLADKPKEHIMTISNNGIIEKEDIVKCIKVEDRGKGATVDIKVGGEYRIIKISKSSGTVISYDVVDDSSDNPRRIAVLPHEVEFLRKRKPPIPFEKGKFEEIAPCDSCQSPVACVKLDDGFFHGKCLSCGKDKTYQPKLPGVPLSV